MTCLRTDEESEKKRRYSFWKTSLKGFCHSRFTHTQEARRCGHLETCLWSVLCTCFLCLHCFLSKTKYLCIIRIHHLVRGGFHQHFGHWPTGAFNQSYLLDLTFSIGFILYLSDGKWFGSFAHLCLFSLHKVHYSLSWLKAEEHARMVPVHDLF